MTRRTKDLQTIALLLTLLLSACSKGRTSPATEAPVPSPPGPPEPVPAPVEAAGTHDCPHLDRVASSDWFVLFDSVQDLESALRAEDPDHTGVVGTEGEALSKCLDGRLCYAWTTVAEWQYTSYRGRLVAARKTRGLPGDAYTLSVSFAGDYAFGTLGKADFRCPERPTDECYPDDNPDDSERVRMACESDLSLSCVEDGSRGVIEVLDLTRTWVHRTKDDFRHVRSAPRPVVLDKGRGRVRVTVQLDGCELRLPMLKSGGSPE